MADDPSDVGADLAPSATLIIGSSVVCSDGPGWHLQRVVIDPVRRIVTHLVVEPDHSSAGGRLVSVAIVDSSKPSVHLDRTIAELAALPVAQQNQPLDLGDVDSPAHPAGIPLQAIKKVAGATIGDAELPEAAEPDVIGICRVPIGAVEVRRGESVRATDGDIGRVQGLVMDPTDDQVTHVLLEDGRLWGRKSVVIPIRSVADVRDGVRVDLSKEQVRALPAVRSRSDS